MNTANAPEQLLFRYGLDDGVAVVRVTGEVDVATCGLLRDSLLRIVTGEDFRGLVVNLAGVRFMDSTGIGVLAGVWRRVAGARDGGAPAPTRLRAGSAAGLFPARAGREASMPSIADAAAHRRRVR